MLLFPSLSSLLKLKSQVQSPMKPVKVNTVLFTRLPRALAAGQGDTAGGVKVLSVK